MHSLTTEKRDVSHRVLIFPEEAVKLPEQHYRGIPGIEYAGDGKLFIVFYGGGDGEKPGNFISICRSDDYGGTWSASAPAVIPAQPGRQRVFDGCLWLDRLNRLWLFFASAYEKTDDARLMAVRATAPFEEWHLYGSIAPGIMMNKPIIMQNGEWALPVSRWKDMKLFDDTPVGSHIYISADEGRSFNWRGHAATPPCDCNENVIVEKSNGALWMLSRNHPRLTENFSVDGGKSWSNPGFSSIYGAASRFALRRLQSGRLLLVNHLVSSPDVTAEERRTNMCCFLSEDDGASWPYQLIVDRRKNISYPDFTQDEEGRIYLVYDRERFGARKIVLCRFTEDELINGAVPEPLEL